MKQFFKGVAEYTKDPQMLALIESQKVLFNAPTIVNLTLHRGVSKF